MRSCRLLRGGRFWRVQRDKESNRRTLADFTVDFEFAPVPLHHPINRGEPESGAAQALGGEEGLEASAPGFFIHTRAAIADFDAYRLVRESRVQRQTAAVWHRIDGIENEIGQCVT